MSFRHCHHVKVDGTYCQCPALVQRDYCRFHLQTLGRRARMARARARREPYHLVLPILEDLNAVLVARMQVMDALTAGEIEPKIAGLLLYSLQGISADMRSATAPRLGVYDEQTDTAPRATEYAGFEEEFGLPSDLDLSQPPEVLFPAAADAGKAAPQQAQPSAYRSDPWHRVNKEDIELEEVLLTQGEEAYKKRGNELERQSWKQLEREKRQVAQARHVVEAARRNGQLWFSGRLKEHYAELWAEAAAKERADEEETAAMRATWAAEAAARKGPESASGVDTRSKDQQTAR